MIFLLQHILDYGLTKHPDKTAIKEESGSITYRKLDEISNQLANLLLEIEFKPHDVAAVYLPKSINTVIAFLAILKAGGAYIPLDVYHSPPMRIRTILRQSGAKLIISQDTYWQQLNVDWSNCKPRGIILDSSAQASTSCKMENSGLSSKLHFFDRHTNTYATKLLQPPAIIDEDLAYILYTSGSTGQPKGVMLTHRNALAFIKWALGYFSPKPPDSFANHAPFHFDLSVFDLYVSLAAGARLNLVPAGISANPRALVEWMAENQINYWYSVPSVWISILNYASVQSDRLKSMTHILFAGEVFPSRYLRQLMSALPDSKFYNLYGPTETNVCTCYHVKDHTEINDKPVPIGSACANTEIVVLSQDDKPVKTGHVGELLVRGATVTRGYYKTPKNSSTCFFKSPIPHHQGCMLYRTGDLVRKIGDDLFEYVGRTDLMVKCAGYRIELQEIEHAFYRLEAVHEVVVLADQDPDNGLSRIYAFVKAVEGSHLSVISLKKRLSEYLPRYMLPAIIEFVPEIPKNANGKVDRPAVKSWISGRLN